MNKKVFTLWFFNYKNYLKGNTIFKYKILYNKYFKDYLKYRKKLLRK